MSTILKALKKLEERKASEGRRRGDIAWDILREPSPRSSRKLPLLSVLLIAVAGLVLLVFVLRFYAPIETVGGTSAEPVPALEVPVPDPDQHNVEPEPDASQPAAPVANAPVVQSAAPAASRNRPATDPAVPLKVTGIAYQGDEESRLAIVNDLPVMVGTVIDGYVVERIDAGRVVFSRHGELITVSMSSPQE